MEEHREACQPRKASARPSLFAIGSRVEARFEGGAEWFLGTIAAISRAGKYRVKFDDGDVESDMDSEKLRNPFLVGPKIEARFQSGKHWYPGTISALDNGGTFSVVYDDGDKEAKVAYLLW